MVVHRCDRCAERMVANKGDRRRCLCGHSELVYIGDPFVAVHLPRLGTKWRRN